MIQAPIFHVNGDDPEACVRVAELAYEFRKEFHKDVVIDMVCYRRRGHNEGDDPSMTQPLMYNLIEAKRSVRKLYTESLIGRGDITVEDAEAALRDYQQQLERVFVETKAALKEAEQEAADASYSGTDVEGHTGLEPPAAQARDADATAPLLDRDRDQHRGARTASATPSSTSPTASRCTPSCARCSRSAPPACARAASTGAPASSSRSARCSSRAPRCASPGQDSRRGTFVQRHAVLIDKENAAEWTPLLYLGEGQGKFWVYDSLLSEFAAMGFEYGYSVERPDALVLWEAQFGDFFNGAQTIVDEFISSSEQKWGQRSSVVLLLPHGYEGQGPDHSSARIERFLTMCAEDNMTVAYPSTPGVVLPPAAPPGLRPAAPPAHRLHPEVDAAPQGREQRARGLHHRHVPARSCPTARARRAARSPACSSRPARSSTTCSPSARSAATPRRRSCGSSSTTRSRRPTSPAELGQVPGGRGRRRAGRAAATRAPGRSSRSTCPRPWPTQGEHRPLRVISRAASASPATGSTKKHQAEQADLVAQAFDR